MRVSVRYPSKPDAELLHNVWFWAADGETWDVARSLDVNIRQAGVPNVYWTFGPASEVGNTISSLRFDPVNGQVNAAIQWIAVDLSK